MQLKYKQQDKNQEHIVSVDSAYLKLSTCFIIKADVVSNGERKHEETTPDPLLHGMHPERGSEDRYPINTSSEETVPGIIPATEKEHKNESIYTGTCQKAVIVYRTPVYQQ